MSQWDLTEKEINDRIRLYKKSGRFYLTTEFKFFKDFVPSTWSFIISKLSYFLKYFRIKFIYFIMYCLSIDDLCLKNKRYMR